MKRKLIAIFMAIAMMTTMVPAAFAAEPDGGTFGRRTTEITEAEVLADLASEPQMYSANALTKEADGAYHIRSVADFDSITQTQWLGDNTFILETDLDLSNSSRTPSEWGGYITYFRGTLKSAEGHNYTISGMNNNTYLIYGLNGGTIKDITLSFAGEAAGLAAVTVAYSTPIGVRIENVNTTGYVNLTGDDQSNYSPYVFSSPQGGMEMINCTNNARISGSIYGGIFYGYYPLNRGADDDIVFDGCVNNADVTMRNAAMFFGNPSLDDVMATADGNFTITIKNCKNNGLITGSVSAHYFVSSLSENLASGGLSDRIEKYILGDSNQNIAPHQVANNSLLSDRCLKNQGLTGFGVTVGPDKSISIQQPTNTSGISSYVVSVSSYVYLYDAEGNGGGSDRYTVSQTVSASNPVVTLKYYGVADNNYGEAGNGVRVGRTTLATRKDNNGEYYSIVKWDNDDLLDGIYQRYAGTNAVAGYQEPSYLTVTALNAQGQVVGITSYEVTE